MASVPTPGRRRTPRQMVRIGQMVRITKLTMIAQVPMARPNVRAGPW
ncbi:MAG: hypothetical protein ACYC91_16260 [Solirubrobacteraceae bacterium]